MTTIQLAAWLWVLAIILGAVANVIYSQRKLRQMREQASVCDVAGEPM
jgi:hypothetical protein